MFWDVRNVPGCSGMFNVPDFMDGQFQTIVCSDQLVIFESNKKQVCVFVTGSIIPGAVQKRSVTFFHARG